MFPAFALSLALLNPALPDQEIALFSPEDVLHQPLVELMDLRAEDYLVSESRAFRSRIEEERDRKIAGVKQREDEWKKKLNAFRDELAGLNKLGSEDTKQSAERRSELHIEIAALERAIHEKSVERERTIPAAYDLQLAKLWLAEHWPRRRAEIERQIEEGVARERRHGDAEDIGYRRFVKNPEEDVATGQQAARQMAAGGWLPFELQDHEVQAYVRQIAAKLAANSDLKVPLHVTVLDSDELKTIAVPGGFLYVTSGVIRTARSESELAGVLSREIARIAARHATRSSKVSLVSKLVMPVTQLAAGIFTAGAVSPAAYYGIGYGVEGLSGLMVRMLNGTDEKFETEADQLGIQYAWKAGYDPRGFVAFLDSIAGKGQNSFLREEPRLQERMLNVFSEIEYLPPQREAIPDVGDFESVRARLVR